MSKTLTRKAAHAKAHALWGTPGIEYGDRVGVVYLGRKTTPKRFRVGYYTRTPIVWTKIDTVSVDTDPTTWMGSSDLSWEAAFADAERRTMLTGQRP
jgi:hypothetical protein